VIYGDRSALFPRETIDYMRTVLDKSVPVITIAEAHHHLFLDQPLVFVETIQRLLAGWGHQTAAQAHALTK
jgi:pimeloyl-ACP methyl ester carboxylesterase